LFVFFDHIVFNYLFEANERRSHNFSVIHINRRIPVNFQIQAQDFTLTTGLRQHVAVRLAYALNHGRDIVSRIVVRLSDINGPRGGVDKCCGIEVRLKGAPALIVEDTQADLYVAIDRASERIGRTLDRRLARQRDFPAVSMARQPLMTEETP
jgi:putative sigma-54 modulation protein